MAASSPSSAASPPVIRTTPRAPADVSSRRNRPAIETWIPLMMLALDTPRDTMLMTSVSARTAQIEEQISGSSAWSDSGPISSTATPR
jgi:hypothetical protein